MERQTAGDALADCVILVMRVEITGRRTESFYVPQLLTYGIGKRQIGSLSGRIINVVSGQRKDCM